jgi:ABC-type transport system involved in multi-copper enzyme maturation permease subunit
LSVFRHDYRAYTGKLTPLWMRVVVLARYGFVEIWSSKITLGLFILFLLPSIVFLILIYLANSPLAQMALMHSGNAQGIAINSAFFLVMLEIQCWAALVLTAWIAPRLITFDLADNALPILLSHPISRFGYVLGKFIALFSSLSLVTWVPCLLLFTYQCYSAPSGWTSANLNIATGLLIGALLWDGLLTFLGLALSAWVKWRVVATGIIMAAVFVPAGVGGIITGILGTRWGFLLNVPVSMTELWQRLLGAPEMTDPDLSIPSLAIVIMLILVSLVCVAILNARIRAREVVRG